MTTPPNWTPPPVPGQQPEPTSYWPPQQQTPPPAPKTTRQRLIIAGALVAAIVVGGFALAAADKGPTPGAKPTAQTAWDREQAQRKIAGTVDPTPEPTEGPTPIAASFELTPKITDKACFGSAGCNVTFEVNVGYSGPELDPSDTWRITYEVSGVEDGPLIGTIELTGTQYEQPTENVSTTSSKSKLKIKVTEVEKR